MTLRMNATFLKVFKEVLYGLPITKPNVNRGDRIRRGRRIGTLKRILTWSRFALKCHSTVYPRERERERERENTIITRYRNERIRMHEICINM